MDVISLARGLRSQAPVTASCSDSNSLIIESVAYMVFLRSIKVFTFTLTET